jgi:hypothetical protein
VPVPVAAPEVKITTPDSYNGSSDKTEHFLHQCEVYFLGLPGLTAHQRVTFVISYMNKGHALSWAEWMVEEITRPDHIADWEVFKNNVRNSFGDLDHIAMARLKIKEIKQGKESMDDYVVRFEELPDSMMLPSLRFSRRGYPPKFSHAAMVSRSFWQLSPPGRTKPGFSTTTTSSCSSSSIIWLDSPSNNNNQDHVANPNWDHCIRALTSHKCPVCPHPHHK